MGVETIAKELDRLYQFDMNKYLSECDAWKKYGYRIFRNAEGKHKVVVRVQETTNSSDIYNAFGGIFTDIFSGGKC